jgi:hypothetical protein
MISAASIFAMPELGDRSTTGRVRIVSEMRSLGDRAASANNPVTRINPTSPAHRNKITPQTLEPKLSDHVSFRLKGRQVGAYILQRRRDVRVVFAFEIPAAA